MGIKFFISIASLILNNVSPITNYLNQNWNKDILIVVQNNKNTTLGAKLSIVLVL